MPSLGKHAKRIVMIIALCLATIPNSGCLLAGGFLQIMYDFMAFYYTGPFIPVSPYWSQLIEDRIYWEQRYGKVPILDPVEGEHAPLFCLDPPSPDEIIRSMPDDTAG